MTAWDIKPNTKFQAKGSGKRCYQVLGVNKHRNLATIRRIGGHSETSGAFREVSRAALLPMVEKILN